MDKQTINFETFNNIFNLSTILFNNDFLMWLILDMYDPRVPVYNQKIFEKKYLNKGFPNFNMYVDWTLENLRNSFVINSSVESDIRNYLEEKLIKNNKFYQLVLSRS